MWNRALKIVFHDAHDYIYHYQHDGYLEALGAQIVAGIPAEPEQYKRTEDQSTYCNVLTIGRMAPEDAD
jgi:hypothetical protein